MKLRIQRLFLYAILVSAYSLSFVQSISQPIVKEEGISDMQLVFEPGLKVGKVQVRKTFQPSFVVTSKGTLLAFCQGRLFAGADNDPKVILMNKSFDYGKTWENVEVLSSPMNFFAISPWSEIINGKERISFLTCVGLKVTKKYYKNDLELVRKKTGIDIDVIGKDKAAVLCRYYSDDDGKSWNKEFLTGDKSPLYQKHDGITPVFMNTIGQVHKIQEGANKGRMILAAPMYSVEKGDTFTDNFRNHECNGSGIIYSDDQGETWEMDGMISDYLANEASAVSIKNGSELLMIRRINKPKKDTDQQNNFIRSGYGERIAHTSKDGGKTWSEPFFVDISEIMCHGTLARVNDRLYFSIPAGLEGRDITKSNWDDDRVRGAIYFSDDEGASWNSKIVEEGYYSYSTVGELTDEFMITFFSRGGHGRFGIGYRIFTDRWLDN